MSQNTLGGIDALNAHFYDGHISYAIDFFKEELSIIQQKSKEEKNASLQILRELLVKKGLTQKATMCLNSITSNINCKSNYDSKSKINAADLLYLIYEYIIKEIDYENKITLEENINKSEYINLLIVQLDEMASGMCPQGRVNRLFQVLLLKLNVEENT